MKTKFSLSVILICSASYSIGQIIHVPADQPSIQAGINASTNGDTVLVSNGTYFENVRFMGKAITLASEYIIEGDTNDINSTIIDGSQPQHPDSAAAVMFVDGEDTTSIINGFTITGGTGLLVEEFDMRLGGGIASNSAGVKILNNKIINNEINHPVYAAGGGIGCLSEYEENWLVARNNFIFGNNCHASVLEALGAGVYSGTNLIFENNEVFENTCTGINNAQANGGGILLGSQSNTLIFDIHNNYIHDNHCDGNSVVGAGVMLWYSEGMISGNEFWNNSGIAINTAQGGGMHLNGATGFVNIIGNDFYANSLDGSQVQGGGLQVGLPNDLVNVENNSFRQNTITGTSQASGGGLIVIENKEILISNNLFEENIIEGSQFIAGAGISIAYPLSKTEIRNNIISSNTGTGSESGEGGGTYIYNANNVLFEIEGNIFNNNSMNNGGGLSTYNCYNVLLSNNLFTMNTTSGSGGACKLKHFSKSVSFGQLLALDHDSLNTLESIHKKSKVMHPQLINNTFLNNEANHGGAIYSDHQEDFPYIINSIFWENIANSGNEIYYTGTDSLLISYCDIDSTNYISIYGKWKGDANINEDPIFVGYGDHPFSLQDESPCVNTGIQDTTGLNLPEFDLAGNPRLYGGRIEMGAYENQNVITSLNDSFKINNIELSVFPNPIFDKTTIEFTLALSDLSVLLVHDITGKLHELIISEKLTYGNHKIEWNAQALPPGIYFLRLETNGQSITKKLVIL